LPQVVVDLVKVFMIGAFPASAGVLGESLVGTVAGSLDDDLFRRLVINLVAPQQVRIQEVFAAMFATGHERISSTSLVRNQERHRMIETNRVIEKSIGRSGDRVIGRSNPLVRTPFAEASQ